MDRGYTALVCQEVSESTFHPFSELDKSLQEKIKELCCTNCGLPLSNREIGYVVASNGRVVWWHYKEIPNIKSP